MEHHFYIAHKKLDILAASLFHNYEVFKIEDNCSDCKDLVPKYLLTNVIYIYIVYSLIKLKCL